MTGIADARVNFCGEHYTASATRPFTIGRDGDLAVDDNPYLHRQFLLLHHSGGHWQLSNVGGRLAATVADDRGLVQAWLAPGASLPIVFPCTRVWFTAGATTYEFTVALDDSPFVPVTSAQQQVAGATTIGPGELTPDQHLLLIALAEAVLRHGEHSAGRIPANAAAAARLGWTVTKFNRKLDNVCDKFTRQGVRGLHGDASHLASSRRARLVEYAVAARLVTAADLALLPDGAGRKSD